MGLAVHPKMSVCGSNLCRCMKHGGLCCREIAINNAFVPAGSEALSLYIGGSACTDYSFYGNQQFGAGPTAIYLLIMLRNIAEYKPHIFVHENVLGFPLAMILDVLQSMYDIEEVVLQPDIAGWPVERRRKYMIGRLRMTLKHLGHMKFQVSMFHFLFSVFS